MSDAVPSLKRGPPDNPAGNPPKKPKPDVEKILAEARAKAAEVAAKLAAQKGVPPPSKSQSPIAPSPPIPAMSTAAAPMTAAQRLAEMKKRVSATLSKSALAAKAAPVSIPIRPPPVPEPETEEMNRAKGGLDVGLHPALLGDNSETSLHKKQSIAPKYATTLANRRASETPPSGRKTSISQKKRLELTSPSPDFTDPTKNPYYDPSLGPSSAPFRRASKALVFNQKGKYIEQANALRRQAALEAMKKRIAETARKVGIDEDMETDKAFLREPPPEIEWWDQGLTTNNTYEDVTACQLKLDTDDSIITIYIQHPIQLEPPQDKHIPPPKPLPLTAKEQAKKRRQKRMEDLKEKQAKQRLGLEPAPPPKIKKSNMMRVLGEEAVKNPTAVEARVEREIAERKNAHLAANETRKLTKEQKAEKLAANREKDLSKGIHCLVFRIENLSNGKHMFKINKFAEQFGVNGICILNPKFNLVIAEGGEYAISKYKKLFLQRVDWTDNGGGPSVDGEEEGEGAGGATGGGRSNEENAKQATDLSENKCTLIWEGELKVQGFRKFTTKPCPTDAMAKEALSRAKMENFWTQAKNYVKAI